MIRDICCVATGALVGAGVAYYFTKKHYTDLNDKEIAEVVERFRKEKAALINREKPDISTLSDKTEDEVPAIEPEEPDISEDDDEPVDEIEPEFNDEDAEEAESIIEEEGYSFPKDKKKIFADGTDEVHPYLISESDYDTFKEYAKDWLTLYSDGIVSTDTFDVYDLGPNISKTDINRLKTGKEMVLYIRDNLTKKDYELTYDIRSFYSMSGIDYAHYN